MKKFNILWVLLIFLMFYGHLSSQVLVADWENENPTNVSSLAGTLTQDYANPYVFGINTSAEVLKFVREGGEQESFLIDFDDAVLILQPVLKMQVYMPAASSGIITTTLNDANGNVVDIISVEA
ncbi:MAG: hypothetical protein PF517_14450 [Salinivirgaceae bacterium]|jgi:hypothetical protein|nr:hypothetical protein [Salinivirgaceae bacterium]